MTIARTSRLNVLMGGLPIGELLQEPTGRLRLTYNTKWVSAGRINFPLSRSLPLEAVSHSGRVVENYLWNLLPDNADTLAGWARQYDVSHNSAFALLCAVGDDCAGAVQFVSDEWMDRNADRNSGSYEPIDEAEIAFRLRRLREERTWTGRRTTDAGHFSLPGAQPKMALAFTKDGWAVPAGRHPTTHIFKPPIPNISGTSENEFACLRLANSLGLVAARSQVMQFEDEMSIVVERYDRSHTDDGRILRLHQEDMCQALGVHPQTKYQRDGGPGVEDVANLVLAHSENADEAKYQFAKSLIFNYLIGGTDAHAKNFSIIHFAGRRTVSAPLYDLVSYWPYMEKGEIKKLKMAMKISGHYAFDDLYPRHWDGLAGRIGVDSYALRELLIEMSAKMPDAMAEVRNEAATLHIDHPVLTTMLDVIATRCERTLRLMGLEPRADVPALPETTPLAHKF